ncbi:ABC transporter permease [Amnibacterium setariae]|uniref:ABC transporter permease n=1 Tax=Amnibacterium setariae TaxID=2306585 RepID=A0A3A1U165_9MICO|nr:ABC transporter permease [Amnibacterium setariae]RIX30655.1 ABC transporter permease [Amnibacterium setariae]
MSGAEEQDEHGPDRRRTRVRTAVLPGANLPALVVALVIAGVAALYVFSYSTALGAPRPRNVPVAAVGLSAAAAERALGGADAGAVRATALPSRAEAVTAIGQQRYYAALVRTGERVELLVSSASGPSVARVLEADVPAVAAALGTTPVVRDLHPVSPRDPSGTVLFYVALASVIMGFIGAIQTRANANGLTLAGELRWDAVRSLLVALAVTAMVGPIAHLESVPFLPTWGVLALTSWTAGTTYLCWRLLVGARWALLPTWLLFILVSSPASGGAVAQPLLPPFFAAVGRVMPAGATVEALRDLTYFPDHLHGAPYLVLGVWAVITTAAFVALRRRRIGTGVPPQ